ncbi:MAG TPA: hypothetical protein VFX15_12275 [Actinomycetes bacterium]|nr:hypothetical protein [Actinomycetes bacterium]
MVEAGLLAVDPLDELLVPLDPLELLLSPELVELKDDSLLDEPSEPPALVLLSLLDDPARLSVR